MSRHKTSYVISYHGILCHDMSYVTTIAASLHPTTQNTRQMLQASWGASLTAITCVYILILCVISVCYSIVEDCDSLL